MRLYVYRILLCIFDFLKRIKNNNSGIKYTSLKESFLFNWDEVEKGNIQNALIIFSPTIGELNAVRSYIDTFMENHPYNGLIILSNDAQYSEAYHKAYPKAAVGIIPPSIPKLFDELVKLTNPHLAAIAEGPCLFCHFPLRFELYFPVMCLFHKIPLIVLNANPYPKQFASRIYKIEYFFFHKLYKKAISIWFTPYQAFKKQLIEYGVSEGKINIVGDMKYDTALSQPLAPPSEELSAVLAYFKENPVQPLIVAGSVNSPEEQLQIILAWDELKRKYPKAKLVLAPRHINEYEAMVPLKKFLEKSSYNYALRSAGKVNADILVLDVYGELLHFYSIASICYIGRNHGILEPLRFEKPTLVGPDNTWDHDKPTYHMYRHIVESGSIIEIPDMEQMGADFIEVFEDKEKQDLLITKSNDLICQGKGASQRISHYVNELLA